MDWRGQSAYPPYGGYHPPPSYGSPHNAPQYPPPPPPLKLLGVGLDEQMLGASGCHTKNVNSLSWSSGGGQRLATGSDDKTCRVYDVDPTGQVKHALKLDGHTDCVVQVQWDPSSPHRVATLAGDKDRCLRLWDVRAGNKPTLALALQHEYLNLAWSPDGTTVATGSANLDADDAFAKDFMSLVDVRRGKARTVKFAYQVEEFCFSPNSKFLLMTTENGTVEVAPADAGAASSTSSSADGSGAGGGGDHGVPAAKVVRSVAAHSGNCYCLAVDPAGQHLAVGSKDSLVSLWRLAEFLPLRTLGAHATALRSLTWSPDSRFLCSASYDAALDVSCAHTGRRLATLDTGGAVQQVAWQPSPGSRLVAVARDSKGDAKDTRYPRSDFVRFVTVPQDVEAHGGVLE